MPHLTVEYSANLEGRTDLDALCVALLETVLETGLFEVGAVRVRALRADHYAIADRLSENAFIDLNLRIGKGRTAEEKKRTGEALFATAIGLFAAIPALMAYNKLQAEVAKASSRLEAFADEFSAILSRQIDERLAA